MLSGPFVTPQIFILGESRGQGRRGLLAKAPTTATSSVTVGAERTGTVGTGTTRVIPPKQGQEGDNI